jgi:hypothetical protein
MTNKLLFGEGEKKGRQAGSPDRVPDGD